MKIVDPWVAYPALACLAVGIFFFVKNMLEDTDWQDRVLMLIYFLAYVFLLIAIWSFRDNYVL
ncbi:hypothetical protein J7L05_12070 [bacterium]|nr:hypothetical protein [bacterium]